MLRNVTTDFFRNEVIGKTIQFEDDKTVSIDENNEVVDMDGMYTVSEKRKLAIEKHLKVEIKL